MPRKTRVSGRVVINNGVDPVLVKLKIYDVLGGMIFCKNQEQQRKVVDRRTGLFQRETCEHKAQQAQPRFIFEGEQPASRQCKLKRVQTA
jgi:hypothetical protein